jgi:hypothetical protein
VTTESKFLESTTHSVSWLYNRHLADELVVKPDFQRNPVWSDAQKSYLIDTILRGFPIPELYFQSLSDENGKETHVVVMASRGSARVWILLRETWRSRAMPLRISKG